MAPAGQTPYRFLPRNAVSASPQRASGVCFSLCRINQAGSRHRVQSRSSPCAPMPSDQSIHGPSDSNANWHIAVMITLQWILWSRQHVARNRPQTSPSACRCISQRKAAPQEYCPYETGPLLPIISPNVHTGVTLSAINAAGATPNCEPLAELVVRCVAAATLSSRKKLLSLHQLPMLRGMRAVSKESPTAVQCRISLDSKAFQEPCQPSRSGVLTKPSPVITTRFILRPKASFTASCLASLHNLWPLGRQVAADDRSTAHLQFYSRKLFSEISILYFLSRKHHFDRHEESIFIRREKGVSEIPSVPVPCLLQTIFDQGASFL